jgi:hypothetical protein
VLHLNDLGFGRIGLCESRLRPARGRQAYATKSTTKRKNASETLALRNTKPQAYLLDTVRGG